MTTVEIGERIRIKRKERGLSQQELAELASLNYVTVSKYESGKVEPGAKALTRIANVLEVTTDELLGRTEETEKPPDGQPPKTPEARILASGIDKMPERDRERALNLVKLMFDQYSDYFDKGDNDEA